MARLRSGQRRPYGRKKVLSGRPEYFEVRACERCSSSAVLGTLFPLVRQEIRSGRTRYCLMTNHIHIIASPTKSTGLAKALGRAHNDYARWLNVRRGESGHLWQNRYFSCPIESRYLWSVLAYVERNPVRAGMVSRCGDWPCSSAAMHSGLFSRVHG